MDHRSEEMCDVDCKVGNRDPISDPAEENIATTVQPLLDIRESAQSRCAFSEQEMFTGNVAFVEGESISCAMQIHRKLSLFSPSTH